MIAANDVEATLLNMADGRHARQLLRFFKTGPGEYGEGDKFIGLRNPQVRLVVKEACRNSQHLDVNPAWSCRCLLSPSRKAAGQSSRPAA